jgi:putative ABC transport system permease protein
MIRHLLKLVWHRKRANALVMIEIFFSFLVVFAVVTIAASVIIGWRRPLGFAWTNISVIGVDTGAPPMLDGTEHKDDPNRETLARVLREAKSFPEVIDAAYSETPPYGNATSEGRWRHDGRDVNLTRDSVTDDFANVMQLKILRGRWFNAADDAANFQPVVIDSDLAQAFFGKQDVVGMKMDESDGVELRVVGVIAPYRKPGELALPNINMAFFRKSLDRPNGLIPTNMLVRLRPGTPAQFEEVLTKRLHAAAPTVGFRIRAMSRMRDLALRTRIGPLIVFGIVAMFLITMVALGLTGVLWQTVTRRTREIGLRRALGASGSAVSSQVLGEVALLATLALVVGVAIVLQLPLLGIFTLMTPGVFALGIVAALVVIYAITLLCGAYPSLLASRVTPAQALRYE